MRIFVLTTFPEILEGALSVSILKRAREAGQVDVEIVNLRDYTKGDPHRKTDDAQYGGGEGMVMLAEPILLAADAVEEKIGRKPKVLLMSPAGRPFDQPKAKSLAGERDLLFICGHYKGVDDRVRVLLDAEEISIGDYVLTGGELPSLVIIDAVVRLMPGVVGNRDSVESDSFYRDGLLDGPRYTRPRVVRGLEVPKALLSGNHARIESWRYKKALEKTRENRLDLLKKFNTLQYPPDD